MKYRVIYEPEAQNDLLEIYDYIAGRSDPLTALHYIERIEAGCDALAVFPLRGSSVADVRKGLRIVGFERRISIAFSIVGEAVKIVRILYGGRDLSAIDLASG